MLLDDDGTGPPIPAGAPLGHDDAYERARIRLREHHPDYSLALAPPTAPAGQRSVAGNFDHLGWQPLKNEMETEWANQALSTTYAARSYKRMHELGVTAHPEYSWSGNEPSTPGDASFWVVHVLQALEFSSDTAADGSVDLDTSISGQNFARVGLLGAGPPIPDPSLNDQDLLNWIRTVLQGPSSVALTDLRLGFPRCFVFAATLKDVHLSPSPSVSDSAGVNLAHELGHCFGIKHEARTLMEDGIVTTVDAITWFSFDQLAVIRSRISSPGEK